MKVYQIELTNHCNLKCSFCPVHMPWAQRPLGYADLALLDQIDLSQTEYVELQFGGESVLHKDLFEFAKRIRAQGVMVGISTNGTTPFRLDAFDIVTVTRDKEREPLPEFLPAKNVYLQVLGKNHPYEDYTHKSPCAVAGVSHCVTPREYVSIHWDGDVVPCCHCFGKQHVFGNVYQQSMDDIVRSSERRIFLAEMPNTYICSFCQFPDPHRIHTKLLKWLASRCS